MSERDRASVVESAARAGARVADEFFRTDIDVETKDGKTDVVTHADRDAQREVIEAVRESFPEDAIVGEEEDELKEVPERGPVWVIDPIDGTNNYVRDIPVWATSVAAVEDRETVAAANVLPALGDTYVSNEAGVWLNGDPVSVSGEDDPEAFTVSPTVWWAFADRDEYAGICEGVVERFGDMRRFGSAQVSLSMVAAGQLEATVTNVETNPWDTVAGVHMIRQAGGRVTDIEGDEWTPESAGLVASNDTRHEAVLAAARRAIE
ncbi:inositol monophosphatase [Salarchaeum sp. JOR-1]|uniref:inositol monophosphatase family protein n=1 Tax=Salarchaeum sp. JOR-1 TaxID=2599399 RepID=UPI00119830F8|nr:inositol monophosphatase [Salarchaeum sp. JOR-1]QDX41627.1 inositol monophosphatase [Salarchaeum sp. JOR-1]